MKIKKKNKTEPGAMGIGRNQRVGVGYTAPTNGVYKRLVAEEQGEQPSRESKGSKENQCRPTDLNNCT